MPEVFFGITFINTMKGLIFWFLLLLVSLATFSVELNGNLYIKLFILELIVGFLFGFIPFIKCNDLILKITFIDVLIFVLFAFYLFFIQGTADILRISQPIILMLLYSYVRLLRFNDINGILKFAVVFVIIQIILCLLQSFGFILNNDTFFKIGGTFGNPDMLGAYLAVLLPFCYLRTRKKYINLLVIASCLLLFINLQCRTALIASVITGTLFLYKNNYISKNILYIMGIIGVIAFIFLVFWQPQSFLGRIYIWIVCFSMVINKPWGWGIYAFDKYYMEYQAMYTIKHRDIAASLNYDIVDSSYNEFLQIGVEMGLIPMLIYIIIVVSLFRTLYHHNSKLVYPFVTFQIVSLAYFPMRIIPVVAIYAVICAIAVNKYGNPIFSVKIKELFGRVGSITGFVLSISLLAIGSYCYYNWKEAIKCGNNNEIQKAISHFENIDLFMRDNGRFLVSYAQIMNNSGYEIVAEELMYKAETKFTSIGYLQTLAEIYEKNNNLENAKRLYYLAAYMSANDVKNMYVLMSFLCRNGMKSEASAMYDNYKKMHKFDIHGAMYKLYIIQIERLLNDA